MRPPRDELREEFAKHADLTRRAAKVRGRPGAEFVHTSLARAARDVLRDIVRLAIRRHEALGHDELTALVRRHDLRPEADGIPHEAFVRIVEIARGIVGAPAATVET
ncbi:hypothetical protein [Roseicyclus sp.]|uniref:hypothetical protein n=1 Tax=Roseicyclus sp. TaxID=1914329 RepID=UPI003FA14B53